MAPSIAFVNFTYSKHGAASIQTMRSVQRVYPMARCICVDDYFSPMTQIELTQLQAMGVEVWTSKFERGGNLNGYECILNIMNHLLATGTDYIVKIDSDVILTGQVVEPLIASGKRVQWCVAPVRSVALEAMTLSFGDNIIDYGLGLCYVYERQFLAVIRDKFTKNPPERQEEDVAQHYLAKQVGLEYIQPLQGGGRRPEFWMYDYSIVDQTPESFAQDATGRQPVRAVFGGRYLMDSELTEDEKCVLMATTMQQYLDYLISHNQ